MKVIAASFFGLENDKVSGGEIFVEPFPCVRACCSCVCLRVVHMRACMRDVLQ